LVPYILNCVSVQEVTHPEFEAAMEGHKAVKDLGARVRAEFSKIKVHKNC